MNAKKTIPLPPKVQKAIDAWASIRLRSNASDQERHACLKQIQRIARAWGGECLSTEYRNKRTAMTFRCAHGHVFDKMPPVLLGGAFCVLCRRRDSNTRKVQQEMAGKRAAWMPPGVRQGIDAWGDLNLSPGAGLTDEMRSDCLRIMRQIARAWGGECLSTAYKRVHAPLSFRCGAGHAFALKANSVLLGNFCNDCAQTRYVQKAHAYAASRGWTCLTEVYPGSTRPMRWRCPAGHEWCCILSVARRLKNCPVCSREQSPYSLKNLQALAVARGGLCLSEHCTDAHTRLRWQCHKGHVWNTRPSTVVSGSWCPECANLSRIHKLTSKARLKYLSSNKHR